MSYAFGLLFPCIIGSSSLSFYANCNFGRVTFSQEKGELAKKGFLFEGECMKGSLMVGEILVIRCIWEV